MGAPAVDAALSGAAQRRQPPRAARRDAGRVAAASGVSFARLLAAMAGPLPMNRSRRRRAHPDACVPGETSTAAAATPAAWRRARPARCRQLQHSRLQLSRRLPFWRRAFPKLLKPPHRLRVRRRSHRLSTRSSTFPASKQKPRQPRRNRSRERQTESAALLPAGAPTANSDATDYAWLRTIPSSFRQRRPWGIFANWSGVDVQALRALNKLHKNAMVTQWAKNQA